MTNRELQELMHNIYRLEPGQSFTMELSQRGGFESIKAKANRFPEGRPNSCDVIIRYKGREYEKKDVFKSSVYETFKKAGNNALDLVGYKEVTKR